MYWKPLMIPNGFQSVIIKKNSQSNHRKEKRTEGQTMS